MRERWKVSINVILLGLVSFLTDISSEMIHPLLPLFITLLGGGGVAVGIIGGVGDGLSSILKVLSGFLSDKSGKRMPFIFSGYLLSSLCKIALSLSTIWQHILILRPLERVGKGLRTAPRDAIIADSSVKQRGRAFGFHRAMDTSGAVGGSFLAFFLFYFLNFSFKRIFLLAGFIGLLALIPLFWVRTKRRGKRILSFKVSLKELSLSLRKFVFIATLFALGNFSYMFFILRARDFFPSPKLSVALPILLYIWFNIIYTLFSFPLGILSDKVGRKPLIISGYFLFGVVSLLFIWGKSWITFILLFGLYGLVYSLIDGQQRSFVSDLAKEDLKATALGTFHTCVGLAAIPAGLIAGSLWQYVNPEATFIYGGAVGIISAIVFLNLSQ